MKNLKFTLLVAAISFFTILNAQEKPYLILEENGEHYDVFLKIDDVKNVSSVAIRGNYISAEGTENVTININKKKVNKFNNQVAIVHLLDKTTLSAEYTVLLTTKDGIVNSYPPVKVSLVEPLSAKL